LTYRLVLARMPLGRGWATLGQQKFPSRSVTARHIPSHANFKFSRYFSPLRGSLVVSRQLNSDAGDFLLTAGSLVRIRPGEPSSKTHPPPAERLRPAAPRSFLSDAHQSHRDDTGPRAISANGTHRYSAGRRGRVQRLVEHRLHPVLPQSAGLSGRPAICGN
jgi:hypothetical protein